MSDILEYSKGSRRTLYEHFGSKEGLLRTIIEDITERVWSGVRAVQPGNAPIEVQLLEIGEHFLRAVSTPEALSVYRIVVAEGRRNPEITAMFYESGPRLVRVRLCELFEDAQRKGLFARYEAVDLAEMFIGMIIGDFSAGYALGYRVPEDEKNQKAYARRAVHLFMHGASQGYPEKSGDLAPPGPGALQGADG
ncbi:TetR/AcrR family transcriptional regulator C-terminal domain-containing protein [Pararhodospirillum oryzae]|uniref:HTH tetR-type domain-containing protein n=1 Tax=Pararhodospirillum oryzae TaxID=478448 RepID=A0A512H8U2_9PROT|nr:hypothetical protein ROR02_20050 [Pararhodospirillum oryzae]